MQPKISIIIPLYNGAKFITPTLRTLLSSTYSNLELIVVDDGSTDNSLQLCKELSKVDARIHVYTKENGGVASARNFGISKATGKYLGFCDQDDIVVREAYEKMLTSLEKEGSDFCMCSTGRSIDGKKSVYEQSDDAVYKQEEILSELLYPLLFNGFRVPFSVSNKNRYPHIWCCLFRRSFWDKYGFQFRRYINYEDDLLMKVDVLTKATCVSTLSFVGYYWRVNLKSETYASKFVENMGAKQQLAYEDMQKNLASRIQQKNVLNAFHQITFCKQYLDAVHNFTAADKKSLRALRKYYKENIYHRDFDECIYARTLLKKGRVKPKMILPLLAKRMTLLSYIMEVVLDHVLVFTLHSQALTKLERWIKK